MSQAAIFFELIKGLERFYGISLAHFLTEGDYVRPYLLEKGDNVG